MRGVGAAEGREPNRPTPIPSRGEGGLISIRGCIIRRKSVQTPLPSGGAGGGYRFLHRLQIAWRQDDIGIEDDEPFTRCALGAVVTALAGSAVALHEILQVELLFVFSTHVIAWDTRAILHDDDFKILYFLLAEALQQFVHLVGTVINGYNDGVFHDYIIK